MQLIGLELYDDAQPFSPGNHVLLNIYPRNQSAADRTLPTRVVAIRYSWRLFDYQAVDITPHIQFSFVQWG